MRLGARPLQGLVERCALDAGMIIRPLLRATSTYLLEA